MLIPAAQLTEVTVAAGFFVFGGLKRDIRIEYPGYQSNQSLLKLLSALADEIGKYIIAYAVVDVIGCGLGR